MKNRKIHSRQGRQEQQKEL